MHSKLFVLCFSSLAMPFMANAGPVTIPQPGSGSVEGTWPPAGYTIVPFSATADFLGNGKNVTLKGTIQEIWKQALDLKPNFASTMLRGPDVESSKAVKVDSVVKRDVSRVDCNPPFDYSIAWDADEAANWLKRLNVWGNFGPRECRRISCINSSSIWNCNDRLNEPISVHTGYLSDLAARINRECFLSNGGFNIRWVRGEIWESNGFHVTSRLDTTC